MSKGKPCSNLNISTTRDDARHFRNKLHDHLDWTKVYTFNNANAWEKDFWSFDFADAVDFAYFSGHGVADDASFSHKHDDCKLSNTECNGLWGDDDMEWIGFSSCKTLKQLGDFDVWNRWFGCFDGLHLICGWHTNMKDVDFGRAFGRRVAQREQRITSAWKNAARATRSSRWYSNTHKIVILAETWDNLDDHVWGAGSVRLMARIIAATHTAHTGSPVSSPRSHRQTDLSELMMESAMARSFFCRKDYLKPPSYRQCLGTMWCRDR